MTTFSQLVDDIVRETRRPDLSADIADYLNQTIRELHFTPERGAVIHYRENLRELQLTANSDTSFGWDIPRPALFQSMQAVRYDSIYDRNGNHIYASEESPGRNLVNKTWFYYRAGGRFNFSGYGASGSLVSLAYYEYPRALKYYASANRPATWDMEAMAFAYGTGWDATDELKLDARNLTSNWLLVRWRDVVAEGLKAKVYKRASDDARARTSYSLYSQLRTGLFTSEISSGGRLG